MTHQDIPDFKILVPPVNIDTIHEALKSVKSTVTRNDTEEIRSFTDKHGLNFHAISESSQPEDAKPSWNFLNFLYFLFHSLCLL